MFHDDGLWPCKCSRCEHEWYSSIAAMRADGAVACPSCAAQNFIPPVEFDEAVLAARSGRYDFSYLVRIPPAFQSGAPASRAA
jgi:DNA-directed RNA polymerase subunit RPC12/RpoP